VQDGKVNWVDGGGTADAITATYVPAITALVDGQICFVRATAANATTTPTFAPNGLTARTIVKHGGTALAAGDIGGDNHELILRYNLASTRWELLNPKIGAIPTAASTTEVLTGTDTAKFVTADSLAATWESGTDVTDGAAITIGEGSYFNLITSTTAITSFSITTNKAGRTFRVRFDTARTLTHNATSLILPTGANIATAQGDIAQFRSLGSGNVVCEWYTRKNGIALASITQATSQASTSGTSIDFTSIPANVKRVTVMFDAVSTNGTSPLQIQIGDSGGVETSSYAGATVATAGGITTTTFTAGFVLDSGADAATSVRHGAVVFTNLTGNTWCATGGISDITTSRTAFGFYSKTLSATLDRVRVTTVGGADTFDAGTINIMYES